MDTNQRLIRFLNATPQQQMEIDQIFEGKIKPDVPTGPLLMSMSAAAKFLGVGRCTVWRMCRAGRLQKVEVLPNSYRLRKTDLEAIAGDETEAPNEPPPQ